MVDLDCGLHSKNAGVSNALRVTNTAGSGWVRVHLEMVTAFSLLMMPVTQFR